VKKEFAEIELLINQQCH